MDLKINNINYSKPQLSSPINMKGRYTGVPNFHPRYTLNPKQSFLTKVVKFFKALYSANFKKL